VNERRLFGEIAISEGLLSKEQLLQALNRQVKLRRQGKGHKLLGVLLVEMGLLTPDGVFRVLQVFDNEELAMSSRGARGGARGVAVGSAEPGSGQDGPVATERMVEPARFASRRPPPDVPADTLAMDVGGGEGSSAAG